MKSFEPAAAEILRLIVDGIEDEDFGDDMKDVVELGQENFWYQIGGDMNSWVYGGDWYNPALGQIIHFDGVEYDKDVEPEEVEVPAQMLEKLPPEQEDWRENTERDRIIDSYKTARAEFLNNRKKRTFWKAEVPANSDSWPFDKHDEPVSRQFDPETYEQMPLPVRLVEIGRYIGFNEIGDSFKMDYLEFASMLGQSSWAKY